MGIKGEMKDLKLHGEDLQEFGVFSANPHELPASSTGNIKDVGDVDEIWFETASQQHLDNNNNNNHNEREINHNGNNNDNSNNNNDNNGFLDVDVSDPSSLFYAEFPALPDFPCMSSSSSSSSTPMAKPFGACSRTTSSSASTASSEAASWAVLKSDADQDPSSLMAVSMDMVPPPPQLAPVHPPHGVVMGNNTVLDDVDECMDMLQDFGCIDLLENADICWDPSPLFEESVGDHHEQQNDNNRYQFLQQAELDDEERAFEQFMQQHQGESFSNNTTSGVADVFADQSSGVCGGGGDGGVSGSSPPDDLALVFFEWLKSNKEAISAEDLRNIKIKKSTIENAAKRLGGGKEGMKQLLKLILQWVQNHHLHNKRIMAAEDDIQIIGTNNVNNNASIFSIQDHTNNDNINISNNIISPSSEPSGNPNCPPPEFSPTWLPTPPQPQPPFVNDTVGMVPLPAPTPPASYGPTMGYISGDPYSGGNPIQAYPPPLPPSDYHHSWGPTPMQYGLGPHYGSYPDGAQFGGYGTPPAYPGFFYHPGPSEGLLRLGSSATKEARKKRMARQRRFFTHHHRSSHHANHHQNSLTNNNGGVINQHMMNQMGEQHAGVGNGTIRVPHGNWVYWPPPPPPQLPTPRASHHIGPMAGQMMPPQPPMERAGNGFQKQVGIEKKQGWKTEKNLRFLLQKVLKQSDVGNLGRIVLPKKEAETHLPELEARDGIPITMEDIGTSRVWNMRYRFWPNNKSRMYLLENTGDFVRSNGLQEGDFIVIYSDVKCGKYMIRGVKVRPQQNAKPETTNKKSNKIQKTDVASSPSGNGPLSSPNIMQN